MVAAEERVGDGEESVGAGAERAKGGAGGGGGGGGDPAAAGFGQRRHRKGQRGNENARAELTWLS